MIPSPYPLSKAKGLGVFNARQKFKKPWTTYQMLKAAQNYVLA